MSSEPNVVGRIWYFASETKHCLTRITTSTNAARLAAALSYKLIKYHAFVNGNKRTALLAANLFLLQNEKLLQQDAYRVKNNDAITQAHFSVAMSEVKKSELTEVYRELWQPATNVNRTQAARLCEGWLNRFLYQAICKGSAAISHEIWGLHRVLLER